MNKPFRTEFFRKQITKVKTFLFSLLILLVGFSTNASSQTKSAYFIGNSVTDAINLIGLEALSSSAGKTLNWGKHMIPGAPLGWIWDHPTDGFDAYGKGFGLYPTAFADFTWDVVSFQPFDRWVNDDSTSIETFVNLAKTKSPNMQIYIYQRWPRCPNVSDVPSGFTADDWTAKFDMTYTQSYDDGNESRDFFQKLTLATRIANMGIVKPLMVPVGEVMYRLNAQMKAGSIPGYTCAWNLYVDGIHTNTSGEYVASCTYYATIFKADPRGLSVPSEYGTLSAAFVTAVQNTVWDVVSNYKDLSGNTWAGIDVSIVPVTGITLTPATVSIANGATSQLTATVAPATANNKTVAWSSSNPLVATVSATGLITATGAGTATITATTSDGGFVKTCALTVSAPGGTDTQAPTAPTNLVASTVEATTFLLSWTAANDAFGVTGYDVYNGVTKVNATNIITNSYTVAGLASCTTYPTFTVKAKDAAAHVTTSAALSVKTNCAPTAVLNASAYTVASGVPLTFDCIGSTDPDAGDFILGFTWDFGDGTPLSKANGGTHIYAGPGTYEVSLMVMDNRNFYSAPVTKTITVTQGAAVIATWDLAGYKVAPKTGTLTAAPVATKDAGITVSNLALEANRTNDDPGEVQASAIGWQNHASATLADAIANDAYMEFTVTPTGRNKVTITSLELNLFCMDGQENTFYLFSSKNGFAAANVMGSGVASSGNAVGTYPVTGHVDLTAAVTFRVYISNTNPGGSNGSFAGIGNRSTGTADVTLSGTVTPILTSFSATNANEMTIYPNPATDKLNLNFGSEVDKAQMTILDLQGRSLMTQSVANTQVEILNISSLSNGIYFVKVLNGDKVMNAKFVKK